MQAGKVSGNPWSFRAWVGLLEPWTSSWDWNLDPKRRLDSYTVWGLGLRGSLRDALEDFGRFNIRRGD